MGCSCWKEGKIFQPHTVRKHQIKMVNGIPFTVIKLITHTQLPPCPLRPGLGNSTQIHSRTVLCWGGCSWWPLRMAPTKWDWLELFPYTDLQLPFNQPSCSREPQCSPSAQCPWHSGMGHSMARLGHGSATRHWWHSSCILINCWVIKLPNITPAQPHLQPATELANVKKHPAGLRGVFPNGIDENRLS